MDGSGSTIAARTGATADHISPRRRQRRGFATGQLLAGLAIIAAIALLMQLQSGALDPPAFMLPKPPKAKKSEGPLPELFPPEAAAPELAGVSSRRTAERTEARLMGHLREAAQSLGRMKPAAAALLLTEMEEDSALLLLSALRERELALILEKAPPERGAKWLNSLASLPPVAAGIDADSGPGELPLDALRERLRHFRIELGLEAAAAETEPAEADDVPGTDSPALNAETDAPEEQEMAGGEDPQLEPNKADGEGAALNEEIT